MPDTYRVTKLKYAGEKDNPHGGKLHKFYVSLTDTAGAETADVYWQRKSDSLKEGEEFYGDIEDGQYGPRFKTAQRPDSGSRGGSGGGRQDDLGPEFWAAKDKRIGRAGIVQAVVSGYPPPPRGDPDGQTLKSWLDEIDILADALILRLDQHAPSPNSDIGGGDAAAPPERAGSPHLSAPSAVPSDVGFASDKQRDHFERLFSKTRATPETIGQIVLYAESLPTQQLSAQIDLLAANPTPTAKKLASEAAEWAKGQSDVPGDERDLLVGARDEGTRL